MYNLSWTEAQEAMREGKRVCNRHFTGAEWFAFDGHHIVDEKGYYMDKWYQGYDWQDEGWMVIQDNFKPFEADVPEYVWKEEEVRLSDEDRQKIVGMELDFAEIEERILAGYGENFGHLSTSNQEDCRQVLKKIQDILDLANIYYIVDPAQRSPLPELAVSAKVSSYDNRSYKEAKLRKGKGHNKLQKRKKK